MCQLEYCPIFDKARSLMKQWTEEPAGDKG